MKCHYKECKIFRRAFTVINIYLSGGLFIMGILYIFEEYA